MENIPFYIAAVFILVTVLTVFIFYRAANSSKLLLVLVSLWLILQAVIAKTGFYTNTTTAPPRFALAILPPLAFIAISFASPAGRRFIDSLNLKFITILHIVRIPVEIVLVYLFLYRAVPSVMTFEGRNFDILSGITAPLIYYFVFIRKSISYKYLLAWNFICLGLLLNIVSIAILSAPFAFQHFGFDQPNIAILHFPFVWLPACVVPIVLFSHLVAIRQILRHAPNTSVLTQKNQSTLMELALVENMNMPQTVAMKGFPENLKILFSPNKSCILFAFSISDLSLIKGSGEKALLICPAL